jgi:hypothetical protein
LRIFAGCVLSDRASATGNVKSEGDLCLLDPIYRCEPDDYQTHTQIDRAGLWYAPLVLPDGLRVGTESRRFACRIKKAFYYCPRFLPPGRLGMDS